MGASEVGWWVGRDEEGPGGGEHGEGGWRERTGGDESRWRRREWEGKKSESGEAGGEREES